MVEIADVIADDVLLEKTISEIVIELNDIKKKLGELSRKTYLPIWISKTTGERVTKMTDDTMINPDYLSPEECAKQQAPLLLRSRNLLRYKKTLQVSYIRKVRSNNRSLNTSISYSSALKKMNPEREE